MDFREELTICIGGLMICGFGVPLFYLIKDVPFDRKAIKVIIPYVLIGFAGILYLKAYFQEKQALYLLLG